MSNASLMPGSPRSASDDTPPTSFYFKNSHRVQTNYVTEHLIFPHAWVRTAAGRLLNMLFNVVPAAFPRTDRQDDDPLSMIQVGMRDVARKLTQQLKSEHLDITQNLHREML